MSENNETNPDSQMHMEHSDSGKVPVELKEAKLSSEPHERDK